MTLSPSFLHQHLRGIQLALLLLVIFGIPTGVLMFPDYAFHIVWVVAIAAALLLLWWFASEVTKHLVHPTAPPLAEQAVWREHLKVALDQKYPGYQNLINRYLTPAVLNYATRQYQNAARELVRTRPLLNNAWDECREHHVMGADPLYEAQKFLDEGEFFLTDDGIAFIGAYRDLIQASSSPS